MRKPNNTSFSAPPNPGTLGSKWEATVCRHLQRQGLRKLLSNYRCKHGEIDLVMIDQETLVFVEVRYRRISGYASSIETVTLAKQSKLRRSAEHYLCNTWRPCANQPLIPACRFDVIGVDGAHSGRSRFLRAEIRWIKNAF